MSKGYVIIEIDAPRAGKLHEWLWKSILSSALKNCGYETKMRIVRTVAVDGEKITTNEINGDWVSCDDSDKWSSP